MAAVLTFLFFFTVRHFIPILFSWKQKVNTVFTYACLHSATLQHRAAEQSADSSLLLYLRPNSKASHDYERLKSQCMRAMADLQSLQNQHTKTLKRCEEAVKEADFYQ